MSRINYTARVPARHEREVTLPLMTKGMADIGGNVDARSGYGKDLTNCSFINGVLQLGRPGLTFSWYGGPLDSAVVCGVDDSDLLINSRAAPVTSGLEIEGYNGYVASTTAVYRRYWANAGNAYQQIYTGLISVEAFFDMLVFNGDLIFVTTYSLFRYDGSHVFQCGSAYDQITDRTVASASSIYTGAPLTVTWTSRHLHYIKVNRVSAYLKKTGTISGNITASITIGADTFTSAAINIDVGVLTDYAIVDFEFTDVIEMSAATDIILTCSGGDASNCISLGKTSTPTFMIQVNGTESPSGCQLAVFNGRLYIGGKIDSNKVWYSNYNDPDDYYTQSSDGLVTYGGYLTVANEESAQSYGVFIYNDMIVVAGYSNNKFISLFFDENHTMRHRITGARLGGDRSIATARGIFFIAEDSRVGLITSLPSDDEVTINWVSSAIDKSLIAADVYAEGHITYNSKLDQIYVYKSGTGTIFCLQLPSGQWTKYVFASKNITFFDGYRVGTSDGYEFTMDSVFSATDEVGTVSILPSRTTIGIAPIVETHKIRFSRFKRTLIKQCLWDIEDSGFSGAVTISSEKGNADKTHTITGDPPIAIKTRVKDTGPTFKLSGVTITGFTAVGEIALKVSTDGRSNT